MSIEYIAGLFDGEGCVYIGKTGPKHNCYSLYCAISMTDAEPVRFVNDFFPARCYMDHRKTKSGRTVTGWHICGQNAIAFLRAILPHVKGKRAQVLVALEYADKFSQKANNSRRRNLEEKQEQERYYQRLKNLKKVHLG